MAHKKGHKHTGKLERGTMHIKSHMGKDGMAHESHHAANKEHGMGHGFCPPPGYKGHEGQGVEVPGCENND
jgi:hypothetical protein